MIPKLLAALTAAASLAMTSGTIAQSRVELTDLQTAYAEAAGSLFELWNKKEIKIDRTDFDKEFATRFEGFLARQKSDPLESAISAEFIAMNSKILPNVLVPELQLSPGAKLTLIGSIVDAAPILSEKGIEPTVSSLQTALSFSLFAALGAAQEDAKKSGDDQIEAVNVRRGGVWFFSMGWPFCCAIDEKQ
ncbi:MAG: hypothetical protein M9939_02760 [Mesorhizobium sp.]|nr:hypothetical protein [Mesorhizobium sp.]MCO5160030.1 hypothetical protein [Mesorhizobium sp.]